MKKNEFHGVGKSANKKQGRQPKKKSDPVIFVGSQRGRKKQAMFYS